MSNKYSININCVVLSINNQNNQTYVLSDNSNEIIFPQLIVNQDNLSSINESLGNFLKTKIPTINDLQLLGQIIRLHHPIIESKSKNTINSIYGFLVDYDTNTIDSYWIPFSYIDIVKYSSVVFETIQKLK